MRLGLYLFASMMMVAVVVASSMDGEEEGTSPSSRALRLSAEAQAAEARNRHRVREAERHVARLNKELAKLNLRRSYYLRLAKQEKRRSERETKRAKRRYDEYKIAKASAHKAALAGQHAVAAQARGYANTLRLRAKKHRKSAKIHRNRAKVYYAKASKYFYTKRNKIIKQIAYWTRRVMKYRLRAKRGRRMMRRTAKETYKRLNRKLIRRGGRKQRRPRWSRNCRNPTLIRVSRNGRWEKRRLSFAVRHMVQDRRTGVWFRDSSRKYAWRNCKWVLNPVYVTKLRVKAEVRSTNKEAYKSLLNQNDRIKSKLSHAEKVAEQLRARNRYLEKIAGASKEHQQNLLNAMVRVKAKALYSKFMTKFMKTYLKAGTHPRAGSILGDSNQIAGTKYPDRTRDRFDPSPAGTNPNGAIDTDQPDVGSNSAAPRPIRNTRLADVP